MARRRRTVLETHEISAEGGRELPSPPTIIERQSSPQKGGGGGTVLLIVGTLFVGYLYLTKRLQNVVKAIQLNPATANLPGGGPPTNIPPANVPGPGGSNPNFGTVPIAPSSVRRFTLYFPPGFNAQPVMIEASDAESSRRLVGIATLQATGSPTLAALYQNLYS